MTEVNWRRADGWIGAPFEEGLVMVEIDLGTYVGLNDTATAVWDAIEHPATETEIVARLRSNFDVPKEVCTDAVRATLTRFKDVGLVATD